MNIIYSTEFPVLDLISKQILVNAHDSEKDYISSEYYRLQLYLHFYSNYIK